jgi:hypothetical protein
VLLAKAEDRFFDLIDYIFVALYPSFEKSRPKIERLLSKESRRRRFTYNVISRTHFYQIESGGIEPLSLAEAQRNYRNCDRAAMGQFIEDGFFYKCMRPVSTGEYLRNRGHVGELPDFRKLDGVAIHEPDLHGRLGRYMSSQDCLHSCFYCSMGLKKESKSTPWRRFKSAFENVRMLQNLIYRSRTLLYVSHAVQDVFDRGFRKRIRGRSRDIGVPLTPHRLLSPDEVRPVRPPGDDC